MFVLILEVIFAGFWWYGTAYFDYLVAKSLLGQWEAWRASGTLDGVGTNLIWVLLLTPFNLMGMFIVAWLAGALRNSFSRVQTDLPPIIQDGARTRVRLTVYTPFVILMMLTGSICLVGTALEISIYNLEPPVGVAAVVLGLAWGAGGLAFAVQWGRIAAGKCDLVIDEGQRSLHLPMTFGRKSTQPVEFGDVVSVDVEKVSFKSSSDGQNRYLYVPMLHLRDGSAKGERLTAGWRSPGRAEALVRWLKERMGKV